MPGNNLTSDFFKRLYWILFLCGFANFLPDKTSYPRSFIIFVRLFWKVVTACLYIFVAIELTAFFTQPNLSEKQNNDRLVFGCSHPILIIYYVSIGHYSEKIKKLIDILAINLKEKYNDENIEKRMIKQSKVYSGAYIFSFSSSLISYAFDGLMQVVYGDGTFTTVITAWPRVDDKGIYADAARIISYVFWWLFMIRVSAVYVLVISMMTSLSHQYKNLQSYFRSLDANFHENEINQLEQETEYEESIKVGIQLHADTLWCSEETQRVCAAVFSGQILINISVFCLLMLQMMNSERTLMNALAIVSTGIALLISTGFFMWSAGDVTVEAALLTTAMYSSGWEKCRGNRSTRIRRLLVVAMAQSQKPVVLRSFIIMELSYQSYVSIVKSSYSVFSILY